MTGRQSPEVLPEQMQFCIDLIELSHNYVKMAPIVEWSAKNSKRNSISPQTWECQNNETIQGINFLLSHFGGLACKLTLGQEEEQFYTLKNFNGFDEEGLMVWQVAQLPPQAGVHLQGSILIEELRSLHLAEPPR